MCKKNGYSGYKEFIKELIYEQAIRSNYDKKPISNLSRNDDLKDIAGKITHQNILSLEETEKITNYEIVKKIIRKIYECDKLVIFGIGASHIVARDAKLKFTRINKLPFVSEDWHTQLLTARNMSDKDLAIVISYSGKTEEMLKCTQVAKENGAKIVSITKIGESPIEKLADYCLYVPTNELSFRSGAMSSRIAQLNIIDIIYTGYINMMYEESLKILKKTQMTKE